MHIFSAPARPVWLMESEPKGDSHDPQRLSAGNVQEISLCEGVMKLSQSQHSFDSKWIGPKKSEKRHASGYPVGCQLSGSAQSGRTWTA